MGTCRLCGSWSAVIYDGNDAMCNCICGTAAHWHTSTGYVSHCHVMFTELCPAVTIINSNTN